MTAASSGRNLAAIVVVRAASAAGYFVLLPFLGLWLVRTQGLSLGAGGAVVAATILATRAGGVLLAPVVVRFGCRRSITVGYVLAAALLAVSVRVSGGVVIWVALMTVLGLLLSAATTAQKALVAEAFTTETARMKGFGYLNVAVNAGSALGPIVGGIAYRWHENGLPLPAAALLLVAALASLFLPVTHAEAAPWRGFLVFDRELFVFLAMTAGTWVGYSMAFNVLAAYLTPEIGADQIGLLFTLNAVLVIFGQVPVGVRVAGLLGSGNRRRAFGRVCLAGNAVMAVGLLLFPVGKSWGLPAAIAAMAIFTFAEMIWSTLYDAEVAVRRGKLPNAMAYGAAGLVWGGLESAGAWIGLALVAAEASTESPVSTALPFWGAALIVIVTGTLPLLNARKAPAGNPSQDDVDSEVRKAG